MIPFKNIPQNLRVPLFYAEVDNSRANTAREVQRTLIIGQEAGVTSVPFNVPVISAGATEAAALYGTRSMLALMVAAYRANDALGELWVLPVAEDASAVAATGSITFTAAATTNGVLYVYIAGQRLALPVSSTQTTTQLATALAALINGNQSVPVTAVAVSTAVNLTAYHKGPHGNDIDIRLNYLGAAGGEVTPTGLGVTITAMANGAVAPALTTGLTNLGDKSFDFIVCPYNDTTSLNALKTLLNDVNGRWSYAQQVYGHVFAAKAGSLGTLSTFGAGRNNQHESVMGINGSPTPAWIWAAAVAGAAAASLKADPALPLQTVAVQNVLAPPLVNQFVLSDRNTLLFGGVSTFTVDDDGTVRIENLITTYQTNPFGAADNSYLQVETMFTLAFVLRFMKAAITSKFSRVKLASDGTRYIGPGVVTPSTIRAEMIAQYRELEADGYVDNADAFKAGLIVERDSSNPNRVNVLWPGTLIAQLRIFALLAQFRLI